MSLITRDEVRKIAKISCIEVQEAELDIVQSELEMVLRYASSLKSVAESIHKTGELLQNYNVTRPDEIKEFDSRSLVQAAPHHEENFFVVPVIVKQ